MTIATLGLAVDSTQVTRATSALTGLAAAARPAAAGAAALERAATGMAGATARAGVASEVAGRRHGAAAGSLSQLSFQVNDIASGLAMGQSPFQIMAQQGGQVFQVWQMNNDVFKQAGRLVMSLVTPMRLLGIAGAVGAVAAVALNSAWKSSELQFDDVSRSVGTTIGKLHALESAASFKGIETDDFLKASEQFAKNTYQARNNMGGLAEALRANGMQAGTFEQTLANVADLIQRATGDTQKQFTILRDAGLPATMQWVRFLAQGREGIARAVEEAKRFDATANGSLIQKAREFDEAWDRGWKNFANYAKRAVIDVKSALSEAGDSVTSFFLRMNPALRGAVGAGALKNGGAQLSQGDANDFYRRVGIRDPKEKAVEDATALRNDLALQQQRLGLLGQTASALDAVRAVEIQVAQARLSGVNVTNAQVETLKRLALENSLGITTMRASADAHRIEAEVVGMSVGQATAYATAQNAINEAKRAGRPDIDAVTEAVRREAGALGEAAQRADDMRFGYESLVRGPLQAFTGALARGATFFDALKASGLSALNSLSSKLADMAAQNLWKAAFGGSGGGGGFLSSLFGGGSAVDLMPSGLHSGGLVGTDSTFKRATHPAYFENAPHFHTGGMVGDEVPIIAKKGEGVFTAAQMKALAPASGGPPVSITNYNDFRGADPSSEARIRAYVDQSSRRAVEQAVQMTSKTAGNTPSFRGNFR